MTESCRDLERLWLRASCLYECFDESLISDAEWDELTARLLALYDRVSPYFRHTVPVECLQSSTASGVNWSAGLGGVFFEAERLARLPMPAPGHILWWAVAV